MAGKYQHFRRSACRLHHRTSRHALSFLFGTLVPSYRIKRLRTPEDCKPTKPSFNHIKNRYNGVNMSNKGRQVFILSTGHVTALENKVKKTKKETQLQKMTLFACTTNKLQQQFMKYIRPIFHTINTLHATQTNNTPQNLHRTITPLPSISVSF
jgi:hypothetical protein